MCVRESTMTHSCSVDPSPTHVGDFVNKVVNKCFEQTKHSCPFNKLRLNH